MMRVELVNDGPVTIILVRCLRTASVAAVADLESRASFLAGLEGAEI
jgi:hypothetical protein